MIVAVASRLLYYHNAIEPKAVLTYLLNLR